MKRFLSFRGSFYYPSGGMGDFEEDYDSKEAAISGITSLAVEKNNHTAENLWLFCWAHVWDQVERRIVWESPR